MDDKAWSLVLHAFKVIYSSTSSCLFIYVFVCLFWSPLTTSELFLAQQWIKIFFRVYLNYSIDHFQKIFLAMISKMEVLHFFKVLEIGDYVLFCLSFNSILGEVKVKVTQLCRTLYYSMNCSSWYSPSQNTGVGSLSLLQGIFPTQESNWSLLHCR